MAVINFEGKISVENEKILKEVTETLTKSGFVVHWWRCEQGGDTWIQIEKSE